MWVTFPVAAAPPAPPAPPADEPPVEEPPAPPDPPALLPEGSPSEPQPSNVRIRPPHKVHRLKLCDMVLSDMAHSPTICIPSVRSPVGSTYFAAATCSSSSLNLHRVPSNSSRP